ncbi:RidA family protein [Roseomonas sp. OT10]|uniref:Rid family hydrolase n=1 Tax=Roseomonas cutis TaxID=2897332 RepID=UPI001E44AB8B|nr:Rid family hydrolase [Roseomonas sp. OT10]UFN48852.1 RidA family protein [Roseomonas sp. OT10]
MVDVVKVKSGSKFEDSQNYSRIVAVGDLIFVSNTAGIDYATRQISPDAGEQCTKALQNIERALASVGATMADIVKVVKHIPNREDKDKVGEAFARAFQGIDPTSTTLCTPLASDIYKVELEVIAYRGAGKAGQQRLRITV